MTGRNAPVVRPQAMARNRRGASGIPLLWLVLVLGLTTASTARAVCNDGVLDPGEDCDPAIAGSVCCTPGCTFEPATTTCRSAVGVCDVAETCTGTAPDCPADAFAPSTAVCRSATGICDAAETCTGSAPGCPADALAPTSTVCRPGAGPCDAAETCTGCLLYTSPSPRDISGSRMPSSA